MDENTITSETVDTGAEEQITISKAEYAKQLQAESDKRVNQALKTARAKWDAEVGTKIDTHLKDYERKAQMTPEQLQQLDINEKFKLLEAKEKEYQRKTKEIEIAQKLSDKKLSTVLSKFVFSEDMDEVEQNIATLEQLVLGMVNEEVEKRISSNRPKAVQTTGMTKEKFQKMSIAERNALYIQNPTLYKELSTQ